MQIVGELHALQRRCFGRPQSFRLQLEGDVDVVITKLDDGDEKLPEWAVKYAGAPLAITFYILVAVVKTMLTKVRLSTFDTVGNHSSRWVT